MGNLSQQAGKTLYSWIAVEKRFRPGEKLPNEVELSAQLGVSRATLREALRALLVQGVVEVRRGRGTFVTQKAAQVEDFGFDDLARVRGQLRDLFELRTIFEPRAARLACRRATERELEDILTQGAAVADCIRRGADRTQADRAFHAAIVRAAHNEFMMRLLPMIDRAVETAISAGEHKEALAQITLHEGGHLVCGLRSGYRFCSFRVGSLMWMRAEDGHLRLRRLRLAGTGGQCLMAPPDMVGGRLPVTLYNFGGALANLLTAALSLALYGPARRVPLLAAFLLFLAVIGGFSAAMNGIPLRLNGITNDGRKLALDQRLVNPILPSDPNSKAAKCAENVFEIWQRTAGQRSTQMIFCDLSTPKDDGTFSVYDDVHAKLLELGVPENEIAFIHNAKSEVQKKDLFGKVRSGQVRILLGSTQRMGAGTNCQQKLIALHHLDCPWRPSDLQQREGRIIRQGNENPEVDIYSYVTEGTFDAYLYQLVESKQKFISQIMTSKSPVRSAEDVDEQALSYAEIKALASGNPMIKEKMDLDIEVSKLKLLKANHLSQKYALEDAISKDFPKQIAETQVRIAGYGADIATVKENTHPNGDGFSPLTLAGVTHADKKEAGAALLTMCQTMLSPEATQIGSYRGLTLELAFDTFAREYRLTMIGQLRHTVTMGTDVFGNLQRMDNALEGLPIKEQTCREQLFNLQTQLEAAKAEVQKPFPREAELNTKTARLEELNTLLNLDHKEPEIVDAEPDEDQRPPERRRPQLER